MDGFVDRVNQCRRDARIDLPAAHVRQAFAQPRDVVGVVEEVIGQLVFRLVPRRRQEPPREHAHHPAVHAGVPPEQVGRRRDIQPARAAVADVGEDRGRVAHVTQASRAA